MVWGRVVVRRVERVDRLVEVVVGREEGGARDVLVDSQGG